MVWLMYIICALSIAKSFQLQQNRFVPIVSDECKKLGYCEDVENYPEDHVNKIVKQMEERGEMSRKSEESDEKIDINKNEISTSDKEKSLCKSEMQLIRPRAAPDIHGVWHFVINILDLEGRPQPILIETCTFESLDNSCGQDVKIVVPAGSNYSCKQKNAYRKTLGLAHNGTVVEHFMSFPNCCDCLGSHTHDRIKDGTDWKHF